MSVLGYACDHSRFPPFDTMRKEIEARCAELAPEWQFYADSIRVERFSWSRRPAWGQVLDRIANNDHLVLYDIRQLDNKLSLRAKCLKQLIDGGVHVHLVHFGEESLEDLHGAAGVAFVKILCANSSQDKRRSKRPPPRKRRPSTSMAVHQLKPRTHPGYGKTYYRQDATHWVVVWCPMQCDIIREIKGRRDAGETFASIARDFYKQRVTDGVGRLWCKRKRKRKQKPMPCREYDLTRLMSVYRWYVKLLESGGRLEA